MKKLLLSLFTFLLFAAVSGCDLGQAGNLVIQTEKGIIRGKNEDGVLVFRGIPYAKAPVGELRWKAPLDNEPWAGVKDCFEDPLFAVQGPSVDSWESEDCLYLNVWMPGPSVLAEQEVETPMRPVYVWIHGGANVSGGIGTNPEELGSHGHDFTEFVKKTGMVVVAIQYRLGPLGFISPDMVSLDSPLPEDDPVEILAKSGNIGLADQVKALQWVQKEIPLFMGNRYNVTIAGQSAGARDVMALLTAVKPGTREYVTKISGKLFHKAIVQSTCKLAIERSENNGDAAELARAAGVTSLDELRNTDIETVWAHWNSVRWHLCGNWNSGPIIGEQTTLPTDTAEMIETGKYRKDVKLMIGTTRDEVSAWVFEYFMTDAAAACIDPNDFALFLDPDIYGWAFAVQDGVLHSGIGQLATSAMMFNPDNVLTYRDFEQTGGLIWDVIRYTSRFYNSYTHNILDNLSAHCSKAYVYQFNWNNITALSSSPHGYEICFFEGRVPEVITQTTSMGAFDMVNFDLEGSSLLSDAMIEYVKNFCYNGNPGTVGDILWKSWSRSKSNVMIFNSEEGILDNACIDIQETHRTPLDPSTVEIQKEDLNSLKVEIENLGDDKEISRQWIKTIIGDHGAWNFTEGKWN